MYVYMLRCRDGSLYTGMAAEPARRLRQHLGLLPGGARYTRANPPVSAVALWRCGDKSAALRLEALIKRLPRTQKLQLLAAPDAAEALFGDRLRGSCCIPEPELLETLNTLLAQLSGSEKEIGHG